ncbi:MAG: hypothetical protein KY391_08505 [Actinobacteria bacterium]|nr:hypothetical protein [Actinomycetota bacterium]
MNARPTSEQSGRPNKLRLAKLAQIQALRDEANERLLEISDQEFLIAGLALYAAEGNKRDGEVSLANTDPRIILFFCRWLRRFFEVDESRMRLRLYLHEGLDIEEANAFWSGLTGIPVTAFQKPYRAKADPSIRNSKHPMGCPSVRYSCSRTHRGIMGMVDALLSWPTRSGVAQ